MSIHRAALACLLFATLRPATAVDDARRARQDRLEFMKARLAEFELQSDRNPPSPIVLADEPALRWTNPVRGVNGDGATFLWLRGGRPAALATVSIRTGGKVFREFALLDDEPLRASRKGRIVWSPRKNGLPFGPLEDAPAPAGSGALRLAQMRTLARRFRVDLLKGKPVEARLLSRPLIRYAEPDAGVQDGAVFAFVEATDPEVILILEARRAEAHPDGRWLFSLARMTSPGVEVRLGDRVVWSAPPYWKNPRSPIDSYVEAYEGVYGETRSNAPGARK